MGAVRRLVGGFSPASLFFAGEQGAWYDPSDFSTMFQDAAGTTPVTAVGQPVGRILDKSGRGNHATQTTTTSRPVLQQDASGRYYLLFDGVDDWLSTSSINFTGTDKVTVFAGVRKLSDAAAGAIVELSATPTAADVTARFNVTAAAANLASYGFGMTSNSSGSGTLQIRALTYTAPITNVISSQFDSSLTSGSGRAVTRLNAAAPGSIEISFEQPGTGPAVKFGSFPLYIGLRGGTTLPFNGRIYSLIIRGAQSTAQQIASAEAWVNTKTGAY